MNPKRPSCLFGMALCRPKLNQKRTLVSLFVFALLHQLGPALRGADAPDAPSVEQLIKEREGLAENSKWLEATATAEAVVMMARGKWGAQSCETAEALYRLGYLANCACQPTKAEQVWLEALAIEERACEKDSLVMGRTLRSLGFFYEQKAGDRRWEEFLQHSRQILETRLGPDSVEVAKVICGLGYGHYYWGELAVAQAEARSAWQICDRVGKGAEKEGEHALLLLGWVSVVLHNYAEAEASFSRVVAGRTKRLGTNNVDTAQAMGALAYAYMRQCRFQEARPLYERCLEIQEHEWGNYERENLFETLHQLGGLYLALGQLDKAEELLGRALEVLEQNHWSQKRQVASSLFALGDIYERRGEYQKAHELIQQAAKLREGDQAAFLDSPARYLLHLAQIEYLTGRASVALGRAPAVEAAEARQQKDVLKFTSEDERLNWQREEAEVSGLHLWASLGAAEPLARCILRTKAAVIDSLIEERWLNAASHDPSVLQMVDQLKQARTEVAQIATLELGEAATGGMDLETRARSASAKVDSIEANLARKVTGLGDSGRAFSATPADVQAILSERAVLLEMVRYRRILEKGSREDHYGALLFSRSELRWIPLGRAETIDNRLAVYKHLVREPGGSEGLRQILEELSRVLWKPIDLELPPGTEKVIFSPDSELNFLSVATLLEPDGRFVAERYEISYVCSGRDLLMPRTRLANQGHLTILANPDFGTPIAAISLRNEPAAPEARPYRGLNFLPLPGAEKEGLWLRDHALNLGYDHVNLYLGSQATKSELMRIRSPEILHLATHGFVLPAEAVTASAGLTKSGAWEGHTPLSPMLRSGLALAGAESTLRALAQGKGVRTKDNGIVTAEEICCLDLGGTRLVVLSGCDTGLGEAYTGEGVLGLRRGFAQAGAHNLLMTLWPVQDEATSRLMIDFYKNLGSTGSPAVSLAKTQGSWLKTLREASGVAEACRTAGPFVLSFRGQM